jgi:CheY-like chemotaxis protein
VILANTNPVAADRQRQQLTSLGCRVRVADRFDGLKPLLQPPFCDVLIVDADSFGKDGPELVKDAIASTPSLRVVVLASSDSQWEASYRKHRIFYYAVEPFADNEIVEILNAAFRTESRTIPETERQKAAHVPFGGIRTTNRNGHCVQLLASPALPAHVGGLGWHIKRRLTDYGYPVTMALNEVDASPTNVVKMARSCDRVMVLTATDMGQLPGALVRNTKAEFSSLAGETTSKVTTLNVEPDPSRFGFAGLDSRTTEALADHIAREMAAY